MLNWKKENEYYYLCIGNVKTNCYILKEGNNCYKCFIKNEYIGVWYNYLKDAKQCVLNNF